MDDDGTGTTLNLAQRPTPMWESSLLLLLRLALAGLFLFSGAAKLGFLGSYGNSPVEFATAIRKFQIVQYDLIPYLGFIIPWVEFIGGALLLIGLSSRGAAFLLKMLLAAFTVGMLIVIVRGIEIGSCDCFGGRLAEHFGVVGKFLEAPVGWTSILRNLVLMGLCFVIVWRGPGVVSLDGVVASRRRSYIDSIPSLNDTSRESAHLSVPVAQS